MTDAAMTSRALLQRGVNLERVSLVWNVVGVVVLAGAAIAARSVALAGFGLDSLVEIGASTVVLWELSGTGQHRQRRALCLIGAAFIALAAYIAVQSTVVLVSGFHPRHSLIGIGWTAITAAVMFILAAAKANTGRALNNPVLQTEGRVTFVDGLLATAVLVGLALNSNFGAWWADPAAGFVVVFYALKEVWAIFTVSHQARGGRSAGTLGLMVAVLIAVVVGAWATLLVALAVAKSDGATMADAVKVLLDTIRLVRRLAADPDLPRSVRRTLWLRRLYLASPIDLIPDFFPILGYADDAIVAAVAWRRVVRVARAEAIDRHWTGTRVGLIIVRRLAGLR